MMARGRALLGGHLLGIRNTGGTMSKGPPTPSSEMGLAVNVGPDQVL